MTEPQSTLPLSGYTISKVYVLKQHFEVVDKSKEVPKSEEVSFTWDWRSLDEQSFEVMIAMNFEPSSSRYERFGANLVGRFRRVNEKPNVELESFVTLQAVAIIVPFLRQVLSNLTAHSEMGPYYLPMVNVTLLMRRMKPEEATGAKQLREAFKPKALRARRSARRSKIQ